jgi:hypothetical protein
MIVLLLLVLSPVVYGATFTDSFDDPVFTNSNWTIGTEVQQVWSFPALSGSDSGVHVSTTSTTSPAGMAANNGFLYATANLYVDTLLRLDFRADSYSLENSAGLSFVAPSGNFYGVSIQLDFDGPTAVDLNITRDGENLVKTPVSISFDTFYKMSVQIDSNNIMTAYLYSLDGALLGSVSTGSTLSFDSGIVAIHGSPEITFNDFMLTGDAVDLPNLLTQTRVSQLYVSIFGRASEGEGNAYWQSEQSDMTNAADTMLNTEPAKAYFGDPLNDNQMFIEFIYKNTLGKTYAEDPAGVNYWVDELSGGKSKGQVVATLINAAIDPQYAGLPAQDQFLNKVTVCNYTADTIASAPDVNDLSAFVDFISDVTDDTATVTTAKAAVDAF